MSVAVKLLGGTQGAGLVAGSGWRAARSFCTGACGKVCTGVCGKGEGLGSGGCKGEGTPVGAVVGRL